VDLELALFATDQSGSVGLITFEPQTNSRGTPRGNDVTTLSLRRLWIIYKRTAIRQGTGVGKRDLALSQVAFYAGARGVLRCSTT
jgi:hypothetical protein